MGIEEIIGRVNSQPPRAEDKKEKRGYCFTLKIEHHNWSGYHGHIEVKIHGKKTRIRTNQMITKSGENYYIERHGYGLPINAQLCITRILQQVQEDMLIRFGRIPEDKLRKPNGSSVQIYPTNRYIEQQYAYCGSPEGELLEQA